MSSGTTTEVADGFRIELILLTRASESAGSSDAFLLVEAESGDCGCSGGGDGFCCSRYCIGGNRVDFSASVGVSEVVCEEDEGALG